MTKAAPDDRYYVATAHPSTFISHVLVGTFTHSCSDGLNLLLVFVFVLSSLL